MEEVTCIVGSVTETASERILLTGVNNPKETGNRTN